MTRELYLTMRQNASFGIVYEYYKERFDHSKHTPFLQVTDLANFMVMTGMNVDRILDKCVRYYDEKFDVRTLSDKDGKIIKII